jgi:hypothetical protein
MTALRPAVASFSPALLYSQHSYPTLFHLGVFQEQLNSPVVQQCWVLAAAERLRRVEGHRTAALSSLCNHSTLRHGNLCSTTALSSENTTTGEWQGRTAAFNCFYFASTLSGLHRAPSQPNCGQNRDCGLVGEQVTGKHGSIGGSWRSHVVLWKKLADTSDKRIDQLLTQGWGLGFGGADRTTHQSREGNS